MATIDKLILTMEGDNDAFYAGLGRENALAIWGKYGK